MLLKIEHMLKSIGESSNFAFCTHVEYEIYYFHSGTCTYLIGNRIYALRPGDLIIMDGMTLHRPNPDPAVEYCRTHVTFDPQYVLNLQAQPDMLDLLRPFRKLSNSRINVNQIRRSTIEPLLGEMELLYKNRNPINRQRMLITFLKLLVEVYEEFQNLSMDEGQSTGKRRVVEQVIEAIENQYFEDISPELIAETLHLNKFYISHTFKELTGVTIMDYVMNRRVNQARFLFVIDNELSVTEISYRVGFKHPAHFSRVFKDKIGRTPEQYRKYVKHEQYSHVEI